MNSNEGFTVQAVPQARLEELYRAEADERGNPLAPFPAAGWEPLRCCLSFPEKGESIALVSYSPFESSSPWSETGPIYLHPAPCAGYSHPDRLPDRMRTGPKILRTYRADQSLDYEHITLVQDGADLAEPIRSLLAVDEVAIVHVRAVQSQCFGYTVTR